MDQRTISRAKVLESFGASDGEVPEILAYNENRFAPLGSDVPQFPLPDEPFVAAWDQYAREVREARGIAPLAKYLVQLQLPVQHGVSGSPDYIAATRRGVKTAGLIGALGLSLSDPQRCRVIIFPTPAGRLPLIIADLREDFVALVQALTRRNEPESIPESMGAVMVAGYNNWHRISVLRDRFEAEFPSGSWPNEFRKIKEQKDLYQDRFIILSSGPYSAVQASDLGLAEESWRELALVIRREHECTHYFTRRVFSSMRNNLLDEMIADYVGISAATGRFRADWLLRFMGLESFPKYREGGRLQNYRGDPPLSDRAYTLLQRLVVAAAANLEEFDRVHVAEFHHSRIQPALLLMLTGLVLEEIASREAQEILANAFARCIRATGALPVAGPSDAASDSHAATTMSQPRDCDT